MIPKKIHFCWFGNNPKTELVTFCISSWKKYLPEYEIIEWNESNFDCTTNIFVRNAYEQKKWAFVTDYVRAFVLYKFGGIYLDSDVEIKQNLDIFLFHNAFTGFESLGFPFTAIWGSEAKHVWPEKVLEYYDNLTSFEQTTNTIIVSKLLADEFCVDINSDKLQILDHGIAIYPSTHFCLDLPQNYASHHFNGSWTNDDISFKNRLHEEYYLNHYCNITNRTNLLDKLYKQKKITLEELKLFVSIKNDEIRKHKRNIQIKTFKDVIKNILNFFYLKR